MEEEVKTEEQKSEEVEETNNILRPNTPSKEIIDRRNQNTDRQIAMRVEKYNYKNGFVTQVSNNSNNNIVVNNQPKEEYRLEIKSPNKKNNKLIIIIAASIFLLIAGFTITNMLKPKGVEEPEIVKEKPQPIEEEPKIIETKCIKITDNTAFGYNYIEMRNFFTLEDKIKSYEYINKFDYVSVVPANLDAACNSINEYYHEYDGYAYTCEKKGNTYSYITKVELEIVEGKELTFIVNGNEVTKTIKENLDENINDYKEKLEGQGYSCQS